MENHALNLLLGETTPIDAIIPQLVEKRLLLKVHLDVMEDGRISSSDRRIGHEVGSPKLNSLQYPLTMGLAP